MERVHRVRPTTSHRCKFFYTVKFRSPNYENGFANTKTRNREFLKIIFLGLDENAYRSGRNASWAKLAIGETRGFPGWKHLLFLSQKNSLLYSWSYHDESILHPGRLFTFGTSREGTYSRHGAYSGQGAYFYCESNRKLEDQIIFLKELCTHMDITVEKLRPRPLFL